jgi:hypothetical protein
LCKRQSKGRFEIRGLRRSYFCLRLSAGRGQGCILFELTIGQAGKLCPDIERFFRYPHHVLQLFDLVVCRFHLYSNFFFHFGEIEFGLREDGTRILDLSISTSAIEQVVAERETEGAKVMNEKWYSALIAVAGKPRNIGDIGVFGN